MSLSPIVMPAAPPRGASARWVGRAPAPVRPYLELMRLDRPVGAWLMILPGWVSATLASDFPPDLRLAFVLFVTGVLTRSAGCTINDIVDRRFDAQVPRTEGRPLAAGRIPVHRAWLFFAGQLAATLLVPLTLGVEFFGWMALGWILILAYPLMKRITDWPHVWLGPTMTWFVPVTWIGVTGTLDATGLLLYTGLGSWAIAYDIVYAHQDREADALIGVRSAAVRLGRRSVPVIVGLYAVTFGCLLVVGATAGLGPLYWPAIAVAGAQLRWQVRTLDIDDPAACQRVFLSNVPFAALVLLAAVAGKAL
ncbi:4-hydroxybenzoate octaprenyltransferase [Streptomyces sp. SID3343]|uniref:4-hydroxybenzoate octaprenyltransferase n=1 Tax=Streptomyces sp. SID3343 TaxID=2690260 RepID=UPI00136CE8E6|nr:4-hydroxybenzoate octaprenyltransferase [Streptomyces sp. SID3343]MYW04985.1 4-hydroxybenzoate octaprenyltransferase [Streptomyces sp. SID3343]